MSIRRLLRKLRLRFRRRPRTAEDLLPDYGEYLRLQRDEYLSHESEVERWAEGQRRFLALAFEALPRESRILDCGCGDGVGLEALRRLGFRDPTGFDLSAEKGARARALGFRVEVGDMHDPGPLEGGLFDAILCSHTLEHAHEPGKVLDTFRRALGPGGKLFVVLPYPDPGERNELAHAAKYELGTDIDDDAASVKRFFTLRNWTIEASRRDSFREPEIWLSLAMGAP